MRKLLLGSVALTLFSFSILLFQFSCKKEAEAQQTNNCSETATVNFTINFPTSFAVSTTFHDDNYIQLTNDDNIPTPNYSITYLNDFRDVGSSHQKTYTFEHVIAGNYIYSATSYNNPTVININHVPISIVAGQTYNITINATDWH